MNWMDDFSPILPPPQLLALYPCGMEAILVSHTRMSHGHLDLPTDPSTDHTTPSPPPSAQLLTHHLGGMEAIYISHTRLS